MNKQYRLKKESPECKAGTIFEWRSYGGQGAGYYTPDQEDKTYEIFYPKSAIESKPEWFEEVGEKTWEILSYCNKVLKIVKSANCYETQITNKQDYTIYSIKRLKDSVVFTIGDLYTPKFDHKQPRVVEEIQLIGNSITLYCGGFGITPLDEAYKVEKEQIGATVKGEPVYKGDRVYWINSDYSISKSSPLKEIIGDFQCFRSLADTTEWIIENTYITSDHFRVKNGTTIYGIAIQASGRDIWREQVLPFPKTESSHRKWFSSKANALEYLINNTPLFTINDIFNSSIRKKTHPLHDYHTATQTVIDHLRKNNIPC